MKAQPEQVKPGSSCSGDSRDSSAAFSPMVDEYGKPILKGKSGIVINNCDRTALLPKQLDSYNLDYMFSP